MKAVNRTRTLGVGLILAWHGLSMASGTAQAVTLQQLFDGDSITIGNAVFFDWQRDPASNTSAGFEPDFDQIEVVPIQSGNSVGLRYNAADQWTTVGGTFIDTFFSYVVTTTSASTSIVASQLELVDFEFEDFGGAINIVEELSAPNGDLVALNDVFADNLTGDSSLFDSVSFGSPSQIDVATSVLLLGDFQEDVVRLNTFEQSFITRSIPEPATLGLFAASVLATASAVRRRVTTNPWLTHS